jgi:hypothetical protein
MKLVIQFKRNTKWTKIKQKYHVYNEYKDVKMRLKGFSLDVLISKMILE